MIPSIRLLMLAATTATVSPDATNLSSSIAMIGQAAEAGQMLLKHEGQQSAATSVQRATITNCSIFLATQVHRYEVRGVSFDFSRDSRIIAGAKNGIELSNLEGKSPSLTIQVIANHRKVMDALTNIRDHCSNDPTLF